MSIKVDRAKYPKRTRPLNNTTVVAGEDLECDTFVVVVDGVATCWDGTGCPDGYVVNKNYCEGDCFSMSCDQKIIDSVCQQDSTQDCNCDEFEMPTGQII